LEIGDYDVGDGLSMNGWHAMTFEQDPEVISSSGNGATRVFQVDHTCRKTSLKETQTDKPAIDTFGAHYPILVVQQSASK